MDQIISGHITHKQAKMADIERLGELNPLFLLHSAVKLPSVTESVVLCTCNRIEVYVATKDPAATRPSLENLINGLVPFDTEHNLVQYLTGQDSIRHILRVASGLESMIIGEDQVQSQVKAAFEMAEGEGTAGPILSIVFRKAINVGKKVRTNTKVNKGCVSMGSAAVELAERKVGDLEGKNVLIVGAGEIATLIAKHLADRKPRAVFVSNRTYSRAVELAFALGGKAVRFDSLTEFLAQADVVLCATSATHMVLTPHHLQKAIELRGPDRRMLIIDVSFPRNVAPEVSAMPGVELETIDGLRGIAEENMLRRRAEIRQAERIIAEEVSALDGQMKELRAEEVIGHLYLRSNALMEREVRKALSRLSGNGEAAEEIVRDLAASLTNKLLAEPTESLKLAIRQGNLELLEAFEILYNIRSENDVPREPSP
jgi:glutamyl-tRNA reductase